MGHNIDGKGILSDRIDRQTDAVHRDRPLGRHITGELSGHAEGEAFGARIAVSLDHFPQTIDVTTDDVSPQARGRCQRLFDIDRLVHPPATDGGVLQSFHRNIRHKPVARILDHRQTDAVGGDGVTQLDQAPVELGLHLYAQITTEGRYPDDATDRFYDSRKHFSLRPPAGEPLCAGRDRWR